ncbi:glycerol-3-phosphate acyltransferase 3 [Stegastes partitus]|uniref:Glycerol-3-phosphate acyltransferase 3 n=1 Tax=Stegastes partitus TaxID=144197 RepID=A0A9Y4NEQ2_9TELE|nr:PREDICTED: glycerol-3-phosphate acyltransferase 3 [Stegastes partitus]
MEDLWSAAAAVFQLWLFVVVFLIMLPAMFGLSLGVTGVYIQVLVKILESQNLLCSCLTDPGLRVLPPGIIERAGGSMQEVLGQQFSLSDVSFFSKKGLESIVDDQVTQRFSSEELASWNLLTRTNQNFRYISLRLTVIWGVGVFIRYCVLFPLRSGPLPVSSSSGQVHFLSPVPQVRSTSCLLFLRSGPLPVSCSSGQVHFLYSLPQVRSTSCILFLRSGPLPVSYFSGQVHFLLRAHVAAKTKLPILIFPEGTCINNTSVMMFKKGSFEIGGTIYPVAIKYDPRFGDAFWNSSKFNMVSYLLRMMTSWAIVVNVWYLPPMTLQDGEDAAQFANRVKSAIANQGGLLDLAWDGGLKRSKVKDSFKEEQQRLYSSIIVGQNGSAVSNQ